MEALAASRVDFWHRFFLLVLGMDFKSALGGVRAGFCFDFGGFGGCNYLSLSWKFVIIATDSLRDIMQVVIEDLMLPE